MGINELNLLHYAGFLFITLLFIIFTLRAFHITFAKQSDPIKAVIPRLPTLKHKTATEKKVEYQMEHS